MSSKLKVEPSQVAIAASVGKSLQKTMKPIPATIRSSTRVMKYFGVLRLRKYLHIVAQKGIVTRLGLWN